MPWEPTPGRKPSNPQRAPKSHGRKPSAPPPRTGRNMGKSSSSAGSPGLEVLAYGLLIVPAAVVVGIVAGLTHLHGVW